MVVWPALAQQWLLSCSFAADDTLMNNKVVVDPKSNWSTILIVIGLFSLYNGDNFVCIALGRFFLVTVASTIAAISNFR